MEEVWLSQFQKCHFLQIAPPLCVYIALILDSGVQIIKLYFRGAHPCHWMLENCEAGSKINFFASPAQNWWPRRSKSFYWTKIPNSSRSYQATGSKRPCRLLLFDFIKRLWPSDGGRIDTCISKLREVLCAIVCAQQSSRTSSIIKIFWVWSYGSLINLNAFLHSRQVSCCTLIPSLFSKIIY